MANTSITIFTDGGCVPNPGNGGYAAILVEKDATGNVLQETELCGGMENTTNQQMEIIACCVGLEALKTPTTVHVVSDSQYVVYTMTKGWKRRANVELWKRLDAACKPHNVTWEWVRGHNGHEYNERCDVLAMAQIKPFEG